MATLRSFTPSPPYNCNLARPKPTLTKPSFAVRRQPRRTLSGGAWAAHAYKVVVEHGGRTAELEVEEDETILEKTLEAGLPVPHDCKLGVCMTCPARLVSGSVDQSEGMLSDDVVARGYALLCASYPLSDCRIRTIPEEELLSLQLATAND